MQTIGFGPFAIIQGIENSTGEKAELQVVPAPAIERRIFVIRERQVMLDEDLADPLWRRDQGPGSASQTKRQAFPRRLHVPADESRERL
jgi:hypothetical protein